MRMPTRFLPLALLLAFTLPLSAQVQFRVVRGRMIRIMPGQESQQVQSILSTIDESASNAIDQRDAAEEKLVALGEGSLDAMKQIADSQQPGPKQDALRVAIFRLQNGALDPNALIQAWAEKRGHKNAKATHLLAEAMQQIFPNHLFYTVDEGKPGERSVLAVAADGKVQLLADDPALAKFLNDELAPVTEFHAKNDAARAALILALARNSDSGKPDTIDTTQTGDAITATATQGPLTGTAVVTFSKDAQVATVAVKIEKTPATTAPSPESEPATTPAN